MPKFKGKQNYEYQDKWHDNAYLNELDRSDPLAELEDYDKLPNIRNMPQPPRQKPLKHSPHHVRRKQDHHLREELADKVATLEFTYNVQRDSHERSWLVDSLAGMIHMGWLTDVLRQVKGGKEASVYLCAGSEMTGEEFVAAKIYRPRMFRNLRNDQMYREGRARLDADGNEILNGGMQRAMAQKSEYGQRLMHTSWIEHEYRTMEILIDAGVDMPKPFARGDNAILMEYLGSHQMPAPTLNEVDLEEDEAEKLFWRCIKNLDLMLEHDRIHGDYSAYNILYWEGKVWVIDFPQAVHPDENRNAYALFERDVKRICEYFISQGVSCDFKNLSEKIWRKHKGERIIDIDPSLLSEEDV